MYDIEPFFSFSQTARNPSDWFCFWWDIIIIVDLNFIVTYFLCLSPGVSLFTGQNTTYVLLVFCFVLFLFFVFVFVFYDCKRRNSLDFWFNSSQKLTVRVSLLIMPTSYGPVDFTCKRTQRHALISGILNTLKGNENTPYRNIDTLYTLESLWWKQMKQMALLFHDSQYRLHTTLHAVYQQ